MYESCSCGAGVNTFSKRYVKEWRSGHRHDAAKEVAPEPDKNGSEAYVERANQFDHEAQKPITARIGFQPNGFSPRSHELAALLRAKALKNLGR